MATTLRNQRTYRRNIRRTLALATPDDIAAGLDWYGRAHAVAVELQTAAPTLTLRQCAAILAITSQGTSWSANVTKARKVIGQYLRGERIHRIGLGAEPRIELALAGDPDAAVTGFGRTGSPKLTAFYRSILGEQLEPTIDRWAARIARNRPTDPGRVTPAQIRDMQAAYTAVASETAYSPCELQAITWTTFRNAHARAIYDVTEEVAA